VAWAEATRARLAADALRLDALVGWKLVGGTDLFRTYEVEDAAAMQDKLARGHVWSRIFPYSKTWIRLGLPHPDRWGQLEDALR
jgi:cobalamin biosynthetic protein CobC